MFNNYLNDLFKIFFLNFLFLTKLKKRVVVFDLPLGELQFFENILIQYASKHPKDYILISHHHKYDEETLEQFKSIPIKRLCHIPSRFIKKGMVRNIDLLITTEQRGIRLNDAYKVYSICLFHGQPSKGLTFSREMIDSFNTFFLYGPLHREAFDEFVETELDGVYPQHLLLYNIGYSKSDDLINGVYDPIKIKSELGIDATKKTVLYAPAFNEYASMREWGVEIIEMLAKGNKYNVIAKLAVDCLQPTSNYYATGSIDWFKKIGELETKYSNFKLIRDQKIDKALSCADVLITCVSSVGFEFLAIGKPIIFIDTPLFFSKYLKKRFPNKDTEGWANRTTVNGGREFGLLVKDYRELPKAVNTVLSNPLKYPLKKERLKNYLLYNPGNATIAAVEKIEELLQEKVQLENSFLKCVLIMLKQASNSLKSYFLAEIKKLLNKHGYSLQKTGAGFIDARETITAAKKASLSICGFRESQETNPLKKGRRNRIIEKLKENKVFENCKTVCEIGTGTGMYLEKVLEIANSYKYEVYETSIDWVKYLKETYSGINNCKLLLHSADGISLKETQTGTCDLVHAHAVFVYIPLLNIISYLNECVRVCKKNGYIVFDCFLDTFFSIKTSSVWISNNHLFPVIFPKKMLLDFIEQNDLAIVTTFDEIYGDSYSNYLILRKIK